jgi:argininosuccinate synthase
MSIVLAFSGGLDTSFCVPYLIEESGLPVITVTVNTGGLSQEEAARIEARAIELGAEKHFTVDGRPELFTDLIAYLIKGNVLRGDVYPLCVGPERVTQAQKVVEVARKVGATFVAHGSTGAGNDQVRFDVALRQLAGDLKILTPIRTLGLSREHASEFLKTRGFAVENKTTRYSINRGLWGTTIGGGETHDAAKPLPSEAYPFTISPTASPDEALELSIGFEKGVPTSLDGNAMNPVALIETLEEIGAQYGVGRGMHLGDTILGIKGRVGFEAPAASVLIPAHRELEKLVLTRWQKFQKDQIADFYGMLLHEGQYFDPVMRDIEVYLDSSQEVVTGSVDVSLYKGSVSVLGCKSEFSLFDRRVATYGEENSLWDGRDAEGFSKIYGLQGYLAQKARSLSNSAFHETHA